MERKLDLRTWKRAATYQLFRQYERPYFNLCFEVDVTELKRLGREQGFSFFLASLFLSMRACNDIEEFRLRLRGDDVIVHERIHPGSTVLNDDETFGFCYFQFVDDFQAFHTAAQAVLAQYRTSDPGVRLNPESDCDDRVYYSVLPWVPFTSFAHARRQDQQDSVPRIVFGKFLEKDGLVKMPVSLELHHALADGLHAGRFYEGFQGGLSDCRRRLGFGA